MQTVMVLKNDHHEDFIRINQSNLVPCLNNIDSTNYVAIDHNPQLLQIVRLDNELLPHKLAWEMSFQSV